MVEKIYGHLLGKECREEKQRLLLSFLAVFSIGLFAHGMQFLSLSPSHDYLFSFFESEGEYVNALELGRYLQPVFRAVTGTAAAIPWSIGLLSLTFLSLAVYGTARMFEIHSKGWILLLAGLMTANITVTATAGTYMTYLGPFSLALTLAVYAALCWKRFTKTGKAGFLLAGSLLIFLSAGLYQAYLFVAVTWILLDSILSLLQDKKAKKVMLHGLWAVGMILLGAALYFLLLIPAEKLTGVGLKQGDYNSVTNAFRGVSSIIHGFLQCYVQFARSFTVAYASVFSKYLILAVHGILVLAAAVCGVRFLIKHRLGIWEGILLAVLLLLLPAAALGIVILNGEMHDLMKYALCGVYLLPMLLADPGKNIQGAKGAALLAAAMMTILIFGNIQTANLLYTEKQLEFDGTVSIMTNVLSDIEDMEGYEPGITEVCFVGYPQEVMVRLPYKDRVSQIIGCGEDSPITHPTKYGYFFRNILQRDVNVRMEELYPDCLPLPQYPQQGSVCWWEGRIVVNFLDFRN